MSYYKTTIKSTITIGIEKGELVINDESFPGALLYLWDILLNENFDPPVSVGEGRKERWNEEIKGALSGRAIYLAGEEE